MNSLSAVTVYITIQPVVGGFIVTYPGDEQYETVTEVATTVSKAVRLARTATEKFSKLEKAEAAETAPE